MYSFHISFVIGCQSYSFLIDTGAAATLLSYPAWNKLAFSGGSKSLQLKPAATCLIGVDGSPLEIKGIADVTLTCGEHDFPTPAIVFEKLAEEAILGLDFLQRYHCTIDATQRKLILLANTKPVVV